MFERLREQILTGKLRPGTLVPPTRLLAQQLGVSRNTVMLAYDRLITEGYLQTRSAVGTFVSFDLPEESLLMRSDEASGGIEKPTHSPRHPVLFNGRRHAVANRRAARLAVDFWVGRADPRSFPVRAWRRLLVSHLAGAGSNITDYGHPAGLWDLRKAVAEHLGPARGLKVTPEQVLIVSGTQEALTVCARLFIRPQTPVVVESPCYQGAAYAFHSHGGEVLSLPVDEHGLDTSALPERPVALAYVTPSHQYPMGVTLSLERRLRLLDWAWRTGAYIIEDDYDSDFRYHGSPLTALKGLKGGDCVIYLGTFSKSMGAGLRIGYMVLPNELIEPATTALALHCNSHPWLEQAALADFIKSGAFGVHLRRIRRAYMQRRDCVVETLGRLFGETRVTGMEGGMHLAWHLPPDFPKALVLQERAFRRGVGIYSLEEGAAHSGSPTPYDEHTIMLGYCAVSERQIREGLGRVAECLKDE